MRVASMAATESAAPARAVSPPSVLRLPRSPRLRELIAIGAVLAVAVIMLAPLTLLGQIPRGYDTDAFYAPFGAFLHNQLALGNLPLWNPHAFAGQPFAADPQSGALYPPALLAYGFLDAPHALVALTTFHYLIAVLGAYATARLIGANRLGSIYAGIAYGVSGQLFARVQALGLLSGAAWIPVCIAASLLVARRRARIGPEVALLAVAMTFLALTGSQQITAVTGVACILVLAVERGVRGGIVGLIAGAGAVALSAVALLPRLEFVRLSVSADGVVDPSGVGHLVLSDVRTLFGPFGSRLSEVATVYAGAFTPALALIALVRQAGARRVPIALGAFGLVWASGLAGFFLSPIPLIRGIAAHEPVRALPLVVLAIAVLAGLSVSSLQRLPSVKLVLGLTLLLALICAPRELLHLKLALAIVVMTAVFAVISRPRVPVLLCGLLLIGALAGDVAWHDYTQRNTRQLAADWQPAAKAFPAAPPTARFLLARRAAEGPSRFVWLTDRTTRVHQLRYGRAEPEQELLLNMAATRYGLDDVSGYDPVHLDSFSAYLRRSNRYVGLDRHFEWVRVPETDKLRRLGVRYYVAQPGQQPPDLPVVFRSKHAVIVEDPEALPLARLNLSTGGIRRGKIIVRQPDRVVIETPEAPQSGRLVLADPAYPGWTVTVDGHAATSLTTRGIFRAVDLPAGAHRVVWTFDPPRLRIGALVSAAALLSLLVVAVVPWALRRRR
jgi:hypothetical protein